MGSGWGAVSGWVVSGIASGWWGEWVTAGWENSVGGWVRVDNVAECVWVHEQV